jgi:hypothetical protein
MSLSGLCGEVSLCKDGSSVEIEQRRGSRAKKKSPTYGVELGHAVRRSGSQKTTVVKLRNPSSRLPTMPRSLRRRQIPFYDSGVDAGCILVSPAG